MEGYNLCLLCSIWYMVWTLCLCPVFKKGKKEKGALKGQPQELVRDRMLGLSLHRVAWLPVIMQLITTSRSFDKTSSGGDTQ